VRKSILSRCCRRRVGMSANVRPKLQAAGNFCKKWCRSFKVLLRQLNSVTRYTSLYDSHSATLLRNWTMTW
jgi:hypothetical protein